MSEVQANIRNTGMSAVRSVLGSFSYDQVNIRRQHFIFMLIFYRSLVTVMNSIEDSIRSSVIQLQYVIFHLVRGYNPDYDSLSLITRLGALNVPDSKFRHSNQQIVKLR